MGVEESRFQSRRDHVSPVLGEPVGEHTARACDSAAHATVIQILVACSVHYLAMAPLPHQGELKCSMAEILAEIRRATASCPVANPSNKPILYGLNQLHAAQATPRECTYVRELRWMLLVKALALLSCQLRCQCDFSS
jgi:hypothetical protein